MLVPSDPPPAGPILPPEITPRPVSNILRRCLSALEVAPDCPQGVLGVEAAPNTAERALLLERRAAIVLGLIGSGASSPDELTLTLYAILGSLRPWDAKGDADGSLAIYRRACRDLPLWAVQAAAAVIVGGPIGRLGIEWDGARPLSSLQVAEASRRIRPVVHLGDGSRSARATVVELEAELAQIDRVLGAEVSGESVTPEDRAKVMEILADLRKSLTTRHVDGKTVERERAELIAANRLVREREAEHRACVEALQVEIAALQAAEEADSGEEPKSRVRPFSRSASLNNQEVDRPHPKVAG